MTILIVDDSASQRNLLGLYLRNGGFDDLIFANSAPDAYAHLEMEDPTAIRSVDLILMDMMMPEINGLEACKTIKSKDYLKDIPIIVVTGLSDMENLEQAFKADAMDYIVKPVNKVELLSRVRSSLKLKKEIDQRKAREQELLEVTRQLQKANQMLERLSMHDGLTDVANRRYFDQYLEKEWRRAARANAPVSLLMIDIDHFKKFNDRYGHQRGDECLKRVAQALKMETKRTQDFIARYGGEEFAAILPQTDNDGAVALAHKLCTRIEELNIKHEASDAGTRVTISIGVATLCSTPSQSCEMLLHAADQALYTAKERGRNCIAAAPADDTAKEII